MERQTVSMSWRKNSYKDGECGVFNRFISIRMHFLSVSCLFLFLRMRFLSGESRSIQRKVLCIHKTWNRFHQKKAPAGCMVTMRWHVFCLELVCSLSCTCPVHIRWYPVDLIRSQTTTWHETSQPEVFRSLTACSADEYWQGTHGNWWITGVKRWSMGPNWWCTSSRG